jgi:F-type H+-transporting ATPase subunit delta
MTTPVARRYAQAFYAQAETTNQVAAADADVELVRATLAGSQDLRRVLESPIVSRDKKRAILNALFSGKVSKLMDNFLALLVDKERERDLAAIAEAYQEMRDAQQNVVVAQVRAAKPLSDSEQAGLKGALASQAGGSVRLETHVDPDLIGGMIVRLGDTVYDGSVRHQLQTLRERFAAAPASTLN